MNLNVIGILFCIPIGIALSLIINDARQHQRKIRQRVVSYRESLPADQRHFSER